MPPAGTHRHSVSFDPHAYERTAPPIIESEFLQSNNRGAVQVGGCGHFLGDSHVALIPVSRYPLLLSLYGLINKYQAMSLPGYAKAGVSRVPRLVIFLAGTPAQVVFGSLIDFRTRALAPIRQ